MLQIIFSFCSSNHFYAQELQISDCFLKMSRWIDSWALPFFFSYFFFPMLKEARVLDVYINTDKERGFREEWGSPGKFSKGKFQFGSLTFSLCSNLVSLNFIHLHPQPSITLQNLPS